MVGEELAAMLPCEVLSDEQVAGLGLDPATAEFDDFGVIYSCQYRPGPGSDPLVSLDLDTHDGVDTLNLTNYETAEARVGPLRALRVTDPVLPGFCQFSMDLSGQANVSIMVLYAGSRDEACALAERVATEVEPSLPR